MDIRRKAMKLMRIVSLKAGLYLILLQRVLTHNYLGFIKRIFGISIRGKTQPLQRSFFLRLVSQSARKEKIKRKLELLQQPALKPVTYDDIKTMETKIMHNPYFAKFILTPVKDLKGWEHIGCDPLIRDLSLLQVIMYAMEYDMECWFTMHTTAWNSRDYAGFIAASIDNGGVTAIKSFSLIPDDNFVAISDIGTFTEIREKYKMELHKV